MKHQASYRYDGSFEVNDAIALKSDLTRYNAKTPVVLDFRAVQFITDVAIDALAAAIKSMGNRRVFGLGFEGLGQKQFRLLGVVC